MDRKPRWQRNRKRSKSRGRRIPCPHDGCLLESNGLKHHLLTTLPPRRQAVLGFLNAEDPAPQRCWLEEFWCRQCNCQSWYLVRPVPGSFELQPATAEHWQRTGIHLAPERGNPSVSEYTLTQSRGPRLR